MGTADLIPDRRRNHFPLNGGKRPDDADKARGHLGAAAARSVLEATIPPPPGRPAIARQMGDKATKRARAGIRAAREALRRSSRPDEVAPSG